MGFSGFGLFTDGIGALIIGALGASKIHEMLVVGMVPVFPGLKKYWGYCISV